MTTNKKTTSKKKATKKAPAKVGAKKKAAAKVTSSAKSKTTRAKARIKAAAKRAPVPKKAASRKLGLGNAGKGALKKAASMSAGVAAPAANALKDAQIDLQEIVGQMRENYAEAATALTQAGGKLDDTRREVMLAIIENAQENTDRTFYALKEMIDAEDLGDSLRIQREAVRETVEQMLMQVKDVSSLAASKGKESITPVTDYISKIRKKEKK